MRFVPLVLLLLAGPALAWPGDADWVAVQKDGVPVQDLEELSQLEAQLDLFGTQDSAVLWWYADSDNLYLRVQIANDPTTLGDLSVGSRGFLIDTDGDLADFEWLVQARESDGALMVYSSSEAGLEPSGLSYTAEGEYGDVQSGAVVVTEADGAFFVDVRFEHAALADDLAWASDDPFRVIGYSGVSYNGTRNDVTSCDDAQESCGDITLLWSDAMVVDADADGLTRFEELDVGTNPNDADSDDDGLIDGLESLDDVDGDDLYGWQDCDSDGDSLTDGLEAGVGTTPAGTNVSVGCFHADTDTNTTPDPGLADTDGGGLADGLEDWNHDGSIDTWETDPNDPDDDVDTDLDGIPDAVEGIADFDGDDTANYLDSDSDDDGITDAVEGLGDVDSDGVPNFLDDDSDNDGISDEIEGDEDSDEDGIPDFIDPDSDGDGKSDADEGQDDVDCDGIPDYLDLNDYDGDCTPPEVDTSDPGGDDLEDPFEQGHLTGGSCSTSGAFPGVLGLLALFGIRRRRMGILAFLGLSSSAWAGEVNAERFAPSTDAQRFVKLEDAELPKGWAVGGGIWYDQAKNPLVYRFSDGREVDVLGDVGTLRATVYGVGGPVRLGVDLPVHLVRSGFLANGTVEPEVGPMPATLGDMHVSAKVAPFRGKWYAASAWADLRIPTGDGEGKVGAGFTQFKGGLSSAFTLSGTTVAVSAGVQTGTGEVVETLNISPALVWGFGVSQKVIDPLWLSAELDGEWMWGNQDEPGATPVEWFAAAHVRPVGDLVVTAGAGTGLTQGIGAPDWRVAGGVAWTPRLAARSAVARTAGGDADGDGVPDERDRCLGQPEDKNGIRDEDGCPDADGRVLTTFTIITTAGTPVAGARLDLVSGPETGSWVAADGNVVVAVLPGHYELVAGAAAYAQVKASSDIPSGVESHGIRISLAPPSDLGHLVVRAVGPSGVPVAGAEVRIVGTLGIPLKTGTDGLFEADLIPGGYELAVAAPSWTVAHRNISLQPGGMVDVTVYMEPTGVFIDRSSKQIFLNRKVFFELDRVELKVESLSVLDDLVRTLKEHPEIRQLRVEGHTDSQGAEAYNLKLSQDRAQAVVAYLIKQGVEPSRLVSDGLGETRLLQQGDSEDVHATNRRVEFHILSMDP